MKYRLAFLTAFGLALLVGCRTRTPEPAVQSVLQGRLTVRPEIDSIPDYRDFEVLVYRQVAGAPDTLGLAITDSTGYFTMTIRAPAAGLYPLRISRRGVALASTVLVVADGDSATLRATFPLEGRRLLVRSRENAAWLAYQNAITQHNQDLLRQLQTAPDSAALARIVERTLVLLQSVEQTYPNTLGAQWAAAEAVRLLTGWNDSLALARFDRLSPDNPRYLEAVRAVRQAIARWKGQQAAADWLRAVRQRLQDPALQVAVQAELIQAYMDSLQDEAARAALDELARMTTDSTWLRWAKRMRYELDHLRPGMEAPFFVVTTTAGRTLTLDDLRGSYVLLEFFWPEDPTYLNELAYRNALAETYRTLPLNVLALSVQPDTTVNEAFFERFVQAGQAVILPGGLQNPLAVRYNVSALPVRWLIDPDGRILGRFEGAGALARLQQMLVRLAARARESSPS
ncbi:TlpA family protein disulfide reductase [Rhodothermus profundi]|uniref:Peroxiredoxin n=1 Tax=Rhodothermus profundi TaxID=633813 RepID=A0A1M6PXT8_9BACT|nr:TlpA disulfide reductase family protein [Rhodothermus profundi]SHK12676.1 Peroxiredoxin [Rhodothermus profundi]